MKQFRVVYEYSRGMTKGAGAAFVVAVDELHARAQLALDMPGASIVQLREEKQDPLAQYERPRLKLVQVEKRRCGSCLAELSIDESESCSDCERQRWAEDAERDRARRSAEADHARREDFGRDR